MKDNTIAHLSDQLAALSARLQEVEINEKPYFDRGVFV